MTPDELRGRIARWEDSHTDFKERVHDNAELAKDLVCFANSDGGQLVIGVAKDGSVVGVDDADALMLRIDDIAFNRCAPPVTAVPETVTLDGKVVLVVNIAKGDQRPYATSGRYFVRSGARCRQASREELLRLFQASTSLFYDEQPLRRYDIGELNFDVVDRYLTDTGHDEMRDDPERVLRAWRLLDDTVPTVAGVVLFGRQPQRLLESVGVVAGRVAGDDIGSDFSDRKDIIGDLQMLVFEVESFLRLHLPISHEVRGFEPERREEIPSTALREAVVNALVHRDYTIPGPVRVLVFDDRAEIRSPGRPPNTIDEIAMRAGAHVPRNPHIYARVADLGLVTRAGSGVPRMARQLREATGAELGINITDAFTTVTLPRGGPER